MSTDEPDAADRAAMRIVKITTQLEGDLRLFVAKGLASIIREEYDKDYRQEVVKKYGEV